MTLVVPRIVSDISYVTRISHDSYFAWQAQYLVMLNCHFAWQAQYLVMLNCHFKVAGAVFGEIWNDSRSAKCCIFQYKMLVVGVKSNLGCEAGCGGRFPARIILGSFSDHSRIGPALEMTFQLFSRNFFEMLESHFAWQAQYLVMLEDATCCSAHCK